MHQMVLRHMKHQVKIILHLVVPVCLLQFKSLCSSKKLHISPRKISVMIWQTPQHWQKADNVSLF